MGYGLSASARLRTGRTAHRYGNGNGNGNGNGGNVTLSAEVLRFHSGRSDHI
jgi:hypothetical protein